jgi:proteasome assembly chaperone (PAC2) family protein
VLDPQGLYQLSDELPELGRPVLIQALAGFVDAGHAGRLAREHLLGTAGAQVVATFDIDQLMDYRSRRPSMIFVEDHWESYDEPALTVHLLRDATDAPYLLLSGPEPDLQWERFILAMLSLVRQLSVRVTVGMNAIPMGVPHTRPTGVTAHATRPELISGYEPWLSRVQVPGGAGNLLEYRLGQHGQDAIGFAVHVPHYLAQAEYPAASVELLASVCRATGLNLSFDALRTAAERVRSEVDRQVSQSEEATAVVRALEEQYDAFLRGRASNLLGSIGPGDPAASRLPTADELGAELERFLAEHAKPDDPGT